MGGPRRSSWFFVSATENKTIFIWIARIYILFWCVSLNCTGIPPSGKPNLSFVVIRNSPTGTFYEWAINDGNSTRWIRIPVNMPYTQNYFQKCTQNFFCAQQLRKVCYSNPSIETKFWLVHENCLYLKWLSPIQTDTEFIKWKLLNILKKIYSFLNKVRSWWP